MKLHLDKEFKMLSTLAKIAKQLESDGHLSLADEVDEIITAIANRDYNRYDEGEIWEAHTEGMEPSEEEELEEAGLEVQEGPEGLGMVDQETYSTLLEKHQKAVRNYIAGSAKTAEMAVEAVDRADLYQPAIVPNSWVEEMVEHLKEVFDEFSASHGVQTSYDPEEFDEAARRLLEDEGRKAISRIS